jgi:hypothetical protein
MTYLYEKKAKEIAIRNILISAIIYFALAGVIFLYTTRENFPLPLLLIALFVGLLVGTVFLRDGIKLFNNNGVWKISVSNNGIYWKSPDEIIDSSFKFNLDEISSTETIVKHSKARKGASFNYFLLLKSGGRHELPGYTGANLKKIISTFEALGVKNEHKVISPKTHINITESS